MELLGPWRIQHVEVGEIRHYELASPGLDDRFWITARVPGDVHTALIERQVIDHPYFGHNDAKCRWIEQKEWWYRTQFHYEKEEKAEQGSVRHELIFAGLDTYATIYVNGLEIGSTENMLMAHSFDVTRVVRNGRNTIAVRFDPLYLHHRDKEPFQWSSYTKERPWLRKAAMNFGWDWGPRMVTVGIWGKVRLERRQQAKWEGVFARTISIGDGSSHQAVVRVDATAVSFGSKRKLAWEIRLLDHKGEQAAGFSRQPLQDHSANAELRVDNPRLWWTHDLGEPYLYTLEVLLFSEDEQVDVYRTPFGIRMIELELLDEAGEPSFAFRLNGMKLFAKGANWIPVCHFIGAASDQRYRDLISLSVEANMNMLRVWAGGIYEKDVFYEECDRAGILVWQDFAFANALFPDYNRNFMENVRKEVADNVLRLRNHASLALWCGNNEIDWLYDMKTSSGDLTCPFYGESIYHDLIPEVLRELDDSRAYWPSSPYGGNDANDPNVGDRHNWQVWHGSVYPRKKGEAPRLDYSVEGVSFKNYKNDYTLFSSEFGMHASANRYTLEKHMPEGEFYWGSAEMAYRNKDTNHQKGILLMEGYTGVPTTITEYMNYSMLTQAEGLKYGIEHYRRNKPRTSGALIWQLNDSWPGTSWSLIDYELLPKASYYYAKRFYHPLLLSIDHEPGKLLHVWAVNDRRRAVQGMLRLSVYDFVGVPVYSRTWEAAVPANSSIRVGTLSEEEVLSGRSARDVVVKLEALDWEEQAPVNLVYLRDQKELRMPKASLLVEANEAEQAVTVTAVEALARMVKLELPQGNIRFSDNFFDLLAGESKTIKLAHPEGRQVSLGGLTVSAFNGEPLQFIMKM